jgi:hypothetical protein
MRSSEPVKVSMQITAMGLTERPRTRTKRRRGEHTVNRRAGREREETHYRKSCTFVFRCLVYDRNVWMQAAGRREREWGHVVKHFFPLLIMDDLFTGLFTVFTAYSHLFTVRFTLTYCPTHCLFNVHDEWDQWTMQAVDGSLNLQIKRV